ncbi:hypothetical protein F4779DRAFT_615289 [Xylariaceae sp. FL0662B]|nr:hypothetical protein F4779DRAFT_615289 [Xylariaceae sp. FL0662B]
MAIIQGLPGIEITVRVEGIEVIEYDDPDANASTQRRTGGVKSVNKYIECIGGARFGVNLRVSQEYEWGHRNHSLNMSLFLDGKWVKGQFCREWNTHLGDWDQTITHRVTRNPSGEFVEQAFQFAEVNKVEDPDVERHEYDLKRVKRMGSVEVMVYRAIENTADDEFRPEGTTAVDFGISAPALKGKAISHGASFSIPVQTSRPRYVGCTNLQEDNGPIAVFRFFYRSREALIQEGVLRRPSTPARPETLPKITLEGLSQEQIMALALEKLQERNPPRSSSQAPSHTISGYSESVGIPTPPVKPENKKVIKREFDEIIDLTEPEEPARPYKILKAANGREVIELDDD